MFMVGPLWARIALRAFVVFVGFLILAGAVNTAIVGSTGVLTRVAEDGVLFDWFRHPHKKYGTNHRIVNIVAILQIATIVLSRGDMFVLGEAYAFGVIWSFVFKTLSVLILRYKDKYHRMWRVPMNLKWFRPGGKDFPLGLALTFLVLFATAVINLFTKEVATISGVAFTLGLFMFSRFRKSSTARSNTPTARNRRSSTFSWSKKARLIRFALASSQRKRN